MRAKPCQILSARTGDRSDMKTVATLLVLAGMSATPAWADETWTCTDGHYTVHEDSIDRDAPPLSYRLVQNSDAGIVGVAPDDSGEFVGMAGIVLRKADGTLLRFGNALPVQPSKHRGAITGSRTEHCHRNGD